MSRSALLPLVLFVACAPKPAPEPPGPPPQTVSPVTPTAEPNPSVLGMTPPEHSRLTAARMHALLGLAESARSRLIRGDLDGATGAGAALAVSAAPDSLPDAWRPLIADALAEADALSRATSPESAGSAIGRMGVTCGTCHQEAGVVDRVKLAAVPVEIQDEDVRMWQHQWAADWMWFGLVSGDDSAYWLGATVFTDPDLKAAPAIIEHADRTAILTRLTDAAEAAKSADTEDQRAAYYGRVIATCAECHSALGGGPPGR